MNFSLKAYSITIPDKLSGSKDASLPDSILYPAADSDADRASLFIVGSSIDSHADTSADCNTVCAAVAESLRQDCKNYSTPLTGRILKKALAYAYEKAGNPPLKSDNEDVADKLNISIALLSLHALGATLAQIGDNRVYQIRQGRAKGEAEIIYRVDEGVQKSEYVHHITDVRPGDRFLLCCADLSEKIDAERLCEIFSIPINKDMIAVLKAEIAGLGDTQSAWVICIDDVTAIAPHTDETTESAVDTIFDPTADPDASPATRPSTKTSAPGTSATETPATETPATDNSATETSATETAGDTTAAVPEPSSKPVRTLGNTILYFSVAFVVAMVVAILISSLFNHSDTPSLDESTQEISLQDIQDGESTAPKLKDTDTKGVETPADLPASQRPTSVRQDTSAARAINTTSPGKNNQATPGKNNQTTPAKNNQATPAKNNQVTPAQDSHNVTDAADADPAPQAAAAAPTRGSTPATTTQPTAAPSGATGASLLQQIK